MLLNTQNLFFLIVFAIIGVILIISCVYCCNYTSTFVETRRRSIQKHLTRDSTVIDEERAINRAHLHNPISVNQQIRYDIHNKY